MSPFDPSRNWAVHRSSRGNVDFAAGEEQSPPLSASRHGHLLARLVQRFANLSNILSVALD
jgi:hypothetical protein